MIVNSPGALRSLLKGHLRLGIDASVAVGKGGGASSAITADIDIDIGGARSATG